MGTQLHCGAETFVTHSLVHRKPRTCRQILYSRRKIELVFRVKHVKLCFFKHWVISDTHPLAKSWWPVETCFSGCPFDTEHDFFNKITQKSSLTDRGFHHLAQKHHKNTILNKSCDHAKRSFIFGYFWKKKKKRLRERASQLFPYFPTSLTPWWHKK